MVINILTRLFTGTTLSFYKSRANNYSPYFEYLKNYCRCSTGVVRSETDFLIWKEMVAGIKGKERLDMLLLKRGMVGSRERARSLIMEGKVFVNNISVLKAGSLVNVDADITLKEDMPYVSRGGLKLEAALEHFGISLDGLTAMDIGSSTGGFTDCMLKRGVKRVYCIDVGYGQLAWQLRHDRRVVLFEKTNIRFLDRDRIPEEVDFITIDVSFISLKKVIPKAREFLKKGGHILALIKPQFEVGKGEVGKGGVVRDMAKRELAVEGIKKFSEEIGLVVLGIFQSQVIGPKGNIEYFIYMRQV